MSLCKCGCGQLTTFRKSKNIYNTYISGHNRRGKKNTLKHTEKQKQTCKEKREGTWFNLIPELCECGCGQWVFSGKKFLRGHTVRIFTVFSTPEGKKKVRNSGVYERHKQRMLNNNPMFNPESRKKVKEWCNSKEGKKQLSQNGVSAVMTLLSKSIYKWNNINFMSRSEMECAKLILNKPIIGYNCHVRVNNNIIDFLPQPDDKYFIGCFVEYHPKNG